MRTEPVPHQYIERKTGAIRTERLFGDPVVTQLYHRIREQAPVLFRMLTSARISSLLGFWVFDRPRAIPMKGLPLLQRCNIDPSECYMPVSFYDNYRKVFERQIRYWNCRPMPNDTDAVVAPADARVLIGSLLKNSSLFLKEKLFDFDELIGRQNTYLHRFSGGSYAVFRLTPEKYHYTHLPVSGIVVSTTEIDGAYHCCNPTVTIALASPLSKNRRTVTIIDTDVEHGSGVGLVAIIEIVALMIGDLKHCYSTRRYDNPRPLATGAFAVRGCPKSLFRPGSSTVVLLFEPDRISFSGDLRRNCRRFGVSSRFKLALGENAVETEVMVRSQIARKNIVITGARP